MRALSILVISILVSVGVADLLVGGAINSAQGAPRPQAGFQISTERAAVARQVEIEAAQGRAADAALIRQQLEEEARILRAEIVTKGREKAYIVIPGPLPGPTTRATRTPLVRPGEFPLAGIRDLVFSAPEN